MDRSGELFLQFLECNLVFISELSSNIVNKYQNNTRVKALTLRYDSTNIILEFTSAHKWRSNRRASHIDSVRVSPLTFWWWRHNWLGSASWDQLLPWHVKITCKLLVITYWICLSILFVVIFHDNKKGVFPDGHSDKVIAVYICKMPVHVYEHITHTSRVSCQKGPICHA